MKKILLALISIYTLVIAKDLNIYVIDQAHLSGINNIKDIVPKDSTEIAIINGISGTTIYRGRADSVPNRYLMPRKIKKSKIKKINTPYVIESIYKMLLPNKDINVKIFFINSIFYKNKHFDFEKGIPSDAFLVSQSSDYNYLNKFNNTIKSYIIVSDRYFINNEHKNGLKRFYYLLFKKINLNLQSFNPNYNTKKENISVSPISNNNLNNNLSVNLTPPKKIHYQDDEFKITHDKSRGLVYGYVKNSVRKNSNISILLNNQEHTFDCDNKGICRFHINLALGDNTLKFKKIDNSEVIKHYNSKYIPNDKIRYIVIHSENENDKKDIFKLESVKTYRPIGSKVELEYKEENKKLYATVDESGYYKFEVPLKHIYNTFILKEYNGQKNRIDVTSDALREKEKERIKKLKEEEERRAKEAKRKKAEEARRKAEEAKRKAEEELKKKGLKKINSIKNDSKYKGKDGDPRINLKWSGKDDLDLYVIDPCGNEIMHSNKHKTCKGKKGKLDIDANNGKIYENPQENITWENGGAKGNYKIRVELFRKREHRKGVPIIITIVNDGETYQKRAIVKKNQDFTIQINHKGVTR